MLLRPTLTRRLLACAAALLAAAPASALRDSIVGGLTLPLAIGHRGLSSLYPENTVISFAAALAAGADGIEGDLHLTADGVIVLMHDDTLDRTTNCTGRVDAHTLAQLANCSAGYPAVFGDKFGFVPIPLFEEVVALISQPQYDSFWVLDLKQDLKLGAKIRPIVDKYGATSRVIMSCWSFDQVADAVVFMNASARQFLTSTVPDLDLHPELWESYAADGVRGFSDGAANVTAEFVAHAHARLFSVVAWTVNDAPTWARLAQAGADGIITDTVDKLVAWLAPLKAAINATIGAAGAWEGARGS
jgi:glycerophosphoryl diester phosphodiesterase